MKKFIVSGVLIFMVSGGVFIINKAAKSDCIAGRGCCSSHSGVCGCRQGRALCCDGTLSPSCQCFKDEIKIGL